MDEQRIGDRNTGRHDSSHGGDCGYGCGCRGCGACWPTWIRSEKFSGRSDVVCDTGNAEAAVAAAKDKAAAVKIGLIIARVPFV
jgi:hypothetical protein